MIYSLLISYTLDLRGTQHKRELQVKSDGIIIYEPFLSMKILMWSVTVCGLIFTLIGGIGLYRGRAKQYKTIFIKVCQVRFF
jgi:hypothetical protein